MIRSTAFKNFEWSIFRQKFTADLKTGVKVSQVFLESPPESCFGSLQNFVIRTPLSTSGHTLTPHRLNPPNVRNAPSLIPIDAVFV